jgi:signal transduction histidine kinase
MDHMPAMSPFSLLRRVAPGVWTAVIWCACTAWSLREFSGIPGMPHVPFGLRPSTALVMDLATATAVAGSALLRRRPLAAVALLTAGSIAAALALGSPTILLGHYLAVDVALGVTVAGQPRPTRFAVLAMTLGALPFYVLARVALGTSHSQASQWAFYALTAAVAWLAGDSVRRAREYAERLRAHAAAEAITAERLRISRELHDMVAHSLGIITLQAGAAARVIDTQPQSARNALYEVESAGREVLAGLRRMLGPLRQAESGQAEPGQPELRQPGPGQAEPRQPGPGQGDQAVLGSMPGLADIERLAAATTAAGVRVDVRWRGERRPLPPDIDLAAFRIVQESVTNVVRHAGVRSCQVLITRDDKTLAVEVADRGHGSGGGTTGYGSGGGTTGRGAGTTGTGCGLAGMRERVALLRGEFSAAPQPEGGFLVTARLPLPAGATPA